MVKRMRKSWKIYSYPHKAFLSIVYTYKPIIMIGKFVRSHFSEIII